ncbi:MAG: aminotransferase class I/II-fold pyridoxal phosphate-dependent enzyme [Deltaproteobacteria bacterium]|jgi:threonine-phosphate decarboxylase|nr:aminotransferase class I/II-fold pyridoxal phosphate-dependent enzyme [Deltaproteobacteria bacterium]
MDNFGHGGRIFEAASLLARPWQEITDFSANINPFGQPKGLKRYIFNDFSRSLHYPEPRAESFLAGLARFWSLPEDHFLPGAGSTVHIFLLARLLTEGLSVIIGPAFSEYAQGLKAAGARFTFVQTKAANNFLVTEETAESVFSLKPKAIFLASPANPSGRLVPRYIMDELLRRCLEQGIYLIADEAFIDFTQGSSLVPLVRDHPYLIVLKSLTKIMAVPGLRLAYLAGSGSLVRALWTHLGPWPLSSPALAAGRFYLDHPELNKSLPRKISVLRNKLALILDRCGRSIPSESNFLLFQYRNTQTENLLDFLFQNGLLVRNAANFLGLEPGWLRLAVRPEKEIRLLDQLLEKYHA